MEYNEKDLISFGKYLLSKERKKLLKSVPSSLSIKEKLKEVYHADIENWKYEVQ